MDLGVYMGEKRIGEMERRQEGLYTRLSCHCTPVILSALPPVILSAAGAKNLKETLHFVQSDIEVPCHSERSEESHPLLRLWLSDCPLGLMEERDGRLCFSRRYSKAELKKLPETGRFQILPEGEKPQAPKPKEEPPPSGAKILRVHINGKKYTVIRY